MKTKVSEIYHHKTFHVQENIKLCESAFATDTLNDEIIPQNVFPSRVGKASTRKQEKAFL